MIWHPKVTGHGSELDSTSMMVVDLLTGVPDSQIITTVTSTACMPEWTLWPLRVSPLIHCLVRRRSLRLRPTMLLLIEHNSTKVRFRCRQRLPLGRIRADMQSERAPGLGTTGIATQQGSTSYAR